MGLRTMATPNGAQAPDFPQPLLNHTDEFFGYVPELGKPMYKMNIGELVQQLQTPSTSSPSSSASIAPSLPSDCTLINVLSQKTVHEVLPDINNQEEQGSNERLATFGETALENLLIQAGDINPGYEGRSQSLLAAGPGVQDQHKWIQYELDDNKQQQQQSMGFLGPSLSTFGNATVSTGFAASAHSGMLVGSISITKATPSDTQMVAEVNQNDEVVDKGIERRQKRMIKNRESAARSRARKQAYINQLEDKVKKLEDRNMQLKRRLEEVESLSHPLPQPRYQLRRTNSAPCITKTHLS